MQEAGHNAIPPTRTGQWGATSTHYSSSDPVGHGGMVTAQTDSGPSAAVRNWNEVPMPIARRTLAGAGRRRGRVSRGWRCG